MELRLMSFIWRSRSDRGDGEGDESSLSSPNSVKPLEDVNSDSDTERNADRIGVGDEDCGSVCEAN